MSLDTANLLACIVAFFHGGIRVLHALRINDQESGFFMAPPFATRDNHLIFKCFLKDADAGLAGLGPSLEIGMDGTPWLLAKRYLEGAQALSLRR